MKINKITLLIAIMIISILAIGAVSAESVDDATISADDGDLSVATADSEISDVSAVAEDAVDNNPLGEPKTIDINDDTYSTYFDENGMLDSVSDYDNDHPTDKRKRRLQAPNAGTAQADHRSAENRTGIQAPHRQQDFVYAGAL